MKLTLPLLFLCWSIGFSWAQVMPRFEFEGYSEYLNNRNVNNSFVGGLSGICYDEFSDRFMAISDNSETKNNHTGVASVYFFTISHTDSLLISDLEILPLQSDLSLVKPESIRPWKENLIISTETGYETEVLKIDRSGSLIGSIFQTKDMSFNRGIEGMSLTSDQKHVFIAMERPLSQETVRGGASDNMGVISIYRIDLETGKTVGRYMYPLHLPPAKNVLSAEEQKSYLSDNGVTEILFYNDSTLLILERAFLGGAAERLHVRLYMAKIGSQNNVLEGNFNLLEPVEVFNFYSEDLPFNVDNIEGMTFGKDKSRLYLISDDNFDHYEQQTTQVISLKIHQ